MNNGMRVFTNPDFGQVRALQIDGEPWFVAVDVCRALEISNNRDALNRLDDDEKGVGSTDTPGGKQNVAIVNEPGLYGLVLGSRKPEAKKFKRWVTHEVLPALRKHGTYTRPGFADGPSPEGYLQAATVIANCRRDRLAFVLNFLRRGGFFGDEEFPFPVDSFSEESAPIDFSVQQALSEIVNDYGVSVSDVAKELGVSRAAVYRYLHGTGFPRRDKHEAIKRFVNEQRQKHRGMRILKTDDDIQTTEKGV